MRDEWGQAEEGVGTVSGLTLWRRQVESGGRGWCDTGFRTCSWRWARRSWARFTSFSTSVLAMRASAASLRSRSVAARDSSSSRRARSAADEASAARSERRVVFSDARVSSSWKCRPRPGRRPRNKKECNKGKKKKKIC